ncbi:uncharacterized protein LOC18446932 isoform X2 [Amborella trichopoda]|uniref:uncharacterized protein LOC18446932 isoform X2 n=1 Tax=Amborella trichopoda TaxID=13333 RepID=UPI0009BCE5D5|nr:uncharacterized protein LOC18446932 isoform X2 [Amborella trichopoda]|eukprot:XP_020530890.1 uncharacterized protein LOC18446932 isoform X2 [Amborella trichopoda]
MKTLVSERFLVKLFVLSQRKSPKLYHFSTTVSASQSRGGLPRFFSDALPSSKGNVVRVQGDEFWHMTKVLRLNVNDRIELFNGKGAIIGGCIQRIDRTGMDFLALEDLKMVVPEVTRWHVVAGFGTLKGGRADWLIEKCTELGASSVTPLLTERSPSISENRLDRWHRVMRSAIKQCQRLHEMKLNPPMRIKDLVPLVARSSPCFLAVAEATPLVNVLSQSRHSLSGLAIIGPEGG